MKNGIFWKVAMGEKFRQLCGKAVQIISGMKLYPRCESNFVSHDCIWKGDDCMTKVFWNDFPVLWDAFEKQLEGHIIKALEAKIAEGVDSGKTKLYSVYCNIGCDYWYSTQWKKQLDEVFFEARYYDTIKQLYQYSDLDVLVAQRMENLNMSDAQELCRLAVMPLLDERKKKLMAAFEEMAKELENPLPYTFNLSVEGKKTAFLLGFQNRHKKQSWDGMDG